MKFLEETQDLTTQEFSDINGGAEEDYSAGYRLGTAIREAVSDAYDYGKGLITGLFS